VGLLATIAPEVAPFSEYEQFPAFLKFFKCILEVVFCESVQHRLRFCLHDLDYVLNGDLSAIYSIGETEKRRVMGDDRHVIFGRKFPGEKEK
jgi:hypothetical protein